MWLNACFGVFLLFLFLFYFFVHLLIFSQILVADVL